MDWQPIETAPTDGTEILIGCDLRIHGDGFQCVVGKWNGSHWMETYSDEYGIIEITHWMPLPSPPEPHYEITAQGRAYLEQMKNEQPNSKDAGQATQGRMAPVGGGEVEPRDEDAA